MQVKGKILMREYAHLIFMPTKNIPKGLQHPVKKGPDGGLHQHSKAGDRGLLAKPIKTGDQGGHFQAYDHGKKRYLLK